MRRVPPVARPESTSELEHPAPPITQGAALKRQGQGRAIRQCSSWMGPIVVAVR
jgi:hypothetical protein